MSDDYDAIVLGGGAPERLWAIGGVTGVWQLAHMGEYEGEVVASNILGETREAHYEAVPRVTTPTRRPRPRVPPRRRSAPRRRSRM
jgi:hypothetical protein